MTGLKSTDTLLLIDQNVQQLKQNHGLLERCQTQIPIEYNLAISVTN